jgi:hypothetical protein
MGNIRGKSIKDMFEASIQPESLLYDILLSYNKWESSYFVNPLTVWEQL